MIHKTCSINYGHLADLQKFATDHNKKNFHLIKYLLATFIFFPFFSICTCCIIPLTTSPAMKSPCFKVKSISYEMKINGKQELPVRKQIRPRPSGFELNWYGKDCTPVMKNSSSERKTKNTQDCQILKFYQIQINSNINQCFPKQFWCWSWRNGLDYSNIPLFVVYGKSPQGITLSCTSLSQPPQPCCPSGWAGGSAGWDYVTVFAELSSSCWHSI